MFRNILKLRTKTEQKIQTLGKRAPIARKAMELLYGRPIIAAAELEKALAVSRSTVHLRIDAP